MTIQVLTLTEFLLARVAEDEDAANAVNRGRWNSRVALLDHDLYGHVIRQHPARVLAECEAKRRIVEEHKWADNGRSLLEIHDGEASGWMTLTYLALPYADHPDYRSEWAIRG